MSIDCNGSSWTCKNDFNKRYHENLTYVYLTLNHASAKITFQHALCKKDELPIETICVDYTLPAPGFIMKIKNIFDRHKNSLEDSDLPLREAIKTRISHSGHGNVGQLFVHHLCGYSAERLIEKVILVLEEHGPIDLQLKKNIANYYKIREYALYKTFLHETFEDLNNELKRGSINTFLLSMKRFSQTRLKIPKVIQREIISWMLSSNIPPLEKEKYFELAGKEHKKMPSKKIDDQEDCGKTENNNKQLCLIS